MSTALKPYLFQPGQSGNKLGKPVGCLDKKTLILKTFTEAIVEGGMERFQEELDKLSGRDYVAAFLNVLEYVRPRLARTEIIDPNKKAVQITVRYQGDKELDEAITQSLESITEGEEIKTTDAEDEF